MNGPHDMGGMQCYGPVEPEPTEPVFHGEWEKGALALTVAMGATGAWNIDMSRSARESLPPAQYLSSSYYQIWIAGLEKLLVARGLAGADEIADLRMYRAGPALARVPDRAAMSGLLAKGASAERATASVPAFAPGDRVRARNINPPGHTRLPRYARGHRGTIETVAGFHVFPDAASAGMPDAHWLYTVSFAARDLFGGQAGHSINVDCWEPYLEPA